MNTNEGNIDDDNEETLGPDRRAQEDDGWGKIRNNNGSTKAIKTKGSWAYARRTLSCDNPSTDPPTIKVPSLTVLAAEQVANHISGTDILQLAPIHAELIQGTGIKMKTARGEGEWSPTHVEQKKEKASEIKGNLLDNDEAVCLCDNPESGKSATITKECMNKDDKN